jgi:hypothetical protein
MGRIDAGLRDVFEAAADEVLDREFGSLKTASQEAALAWLAVRVPADVRQDALDQHGYDSLDGLADAVRDRQPDRLDAGFSPEQFLDDGNAPVVQPEVDSADFRMRTDLGDGEIDGHAFDLAQNIDGQAVFVNFQDGPRVMFGMGDMVQAAYAHVRDDLNADADGDDQDDGDDDGH